MQLFLEKIYRYNFTYKFIEFKIFIYEKTN